MDIRGGYTASLRVVPISVKTWEGTGTLTGVKTFKVVSKVTDQIPKIQSASMSIVLPEGERFEGGWHRAEALLQDGIGNSELVYLGTILFEATSGVNDYGVETVTVKGQSVLKPAEDTHMKRGSYIPKGTNGADWVLDILSRSTPAPVILDDPAGFTIDRYYVFDGGTSVLKAVWNMLDAAGWVLQIYGDGTIHILKKPREWKVEYGRENLRYIKPAISYDKDYSEVPNYYYARLGTQSAEVTNDDKDSPVSVLNRTYVKDVVDLDPVPIDGETMDHYVGRKLEVASTVLETYDIEREWMGDIYPFDNVYWNIPAVHTGPMRVLEQTVTFDQGLVFEEKCGEEVKLWTRS